MKKTKLFLLTSIIFCLATQIYCENTQDSSYANSIIKKIEKSTVSETEKIITNAIGKTKSVVEKYKLHVYLAKCYEENSNLEKAAEQYKIAATFSTNKKNDALLSLSRVELQLGNFENAQNCIEKVLLTSQIQNEIDTARFYSAITQLQKGNKNEAISLLQTYSESMQRGSIQRKVLFLLWYITDDDKTKKQLLSDYPKTNEALVAEGKIELLMKPFWLFMPRTSVEKQEAPKEEKTEITVENFSTTNIQQNTDEVKSITQNSDNKKLQTENSKTENKTSTKFEDIKFQQVGFFKTESYAQELVSELKEKKFSPEIRKTTRPSGITYYAVIISEDKEGNTGKRLRHEGYECAPLFE